MFTGWFVESTKIISACQLSTKAQTLSKVRNTRNSYTTFVQRRSAWSAFSESTLRFANSYSIVDKTTFV